MIVADTNLIAYLMIEGDHTPAAQAVFRADPVWSAPFLWRSEFRNVLALYLRQGHCSLDEALEFMQEAEQLFAGREYQVESSSVLELAHNSNCSAYDCEFVCLARELGVSLVTSDQRVLQAFPGIAVSMDAFAR